MAPVDPSTVPASSLPWVLRKERDSDEWITCLDAPHGSPDSMALRLYSDVPAVTYQWNNSAGGPWETSTNWNPAGPPTSSDIANFNLSANPITATGYTVSVNCNTDACLTLNVESDRVNIAVATTSSTNAASGLLTVAGTLTVAQPPSATTTATTYRFLTVSKTGNGSSYGFITTNAVVVGG
jgi:hypothetical protein